MRENMGLFRGKIRIIDEWVEGSLLKYQNGDCYICCQSDDPAVMDHYDVDPDTVGECTGLRDKNGRLVFEGDILGHTKYVLGRGYSEEAVNDREVVEFGDFNCSCCDGVYGWYVAGGDIREFDGGTRSAVVIGNIHDNPELLERG